jgi:hypothetical protein
MTQVIRYSKATAGHAVRVAGGAQTTCRAVTKCDVEGPSHNFACQSTEKSAVRDCGKRLSDEYKLSDFRHQSAEKLPGEGHKYVVKGE